MAILILKLYFWAHFHPRTMKMIVSVLKLCILDSISSINYQSAFWSLNFIFNSTLSINKTLYFRHNFIHELQNAFWLNYNNIGLQVQHHPRFEMDGYCQVLLSLVSSQLANRIADFQHLYSYSKMHIDINILKYELFLAYG